MIRGAVVAAAICLALPLGAQVLPRPQQAAVPPGVDTTKKSATPQWAPLDSMALELLKRPGMTAVRYQAEAVDFKAGPGLFTLVGKPGARAIVMRDETSLVSDTIHYDHTRDSVRARGDTIVLHDPKQTDDLRAHGSLDYDLAHKEGLAADVESSTRTTEIWHVSAHRAAFTAADSAEKKDNTFYGANGIITSCTDSVPHYHFAAAEFKRISNDVVVGRNVVMFVEGVPVMWLPFMFQDARTGRRSGILTPRFGLTDLVRNSPLYRRDIENVGYYFALSDYVDFAAALDWRSSANATDADPGWTRWNGELRYRWLNQFASGRIGASVNSLSNGTSNTQFSWQHVQDFSIHSHLSANLNFATSTTVQRQTALAPLAALATIASQLNYQGDMGPAQFSVGGTRRQYPGRPQVDQDFPNVSITSRPLSLGESVTWTPSVNMTMSQSQHIDAQGDFARKFVQRSDGTIDSTRVDRGTHSSSLTFNTPLKIGDFQIQAAVRASDRGNDYPELRTVVDPVDTSKKSTRVYEKTWLSQMDFDLGVNLPQFFGGTYNLVPSITMTNIAPGAFAVRSERTGSNWATQGKRFNYGLGISPTFFALYNGYGVGGIDKIRHSVQTSLSYSYSPAATVGNDYLAALGQTQTGFLGSLAQNRVTLGVQQVFEAKLATPDSVNPDRGKIVKLLSLNLSPLTWDFEKARKSSHHSGFATDNLDVSLHSDLLPGFDAGATWSLFQGNVLSDSAIFSPYLQSIRASFSLGAGSGIPGLFGRLFGGPDDEQPPPDTAARAGSQGARQQGGANTGFAGQGIRRSPIDVPSGKGFEAQLSFSLSQQRPPVGGNVVQYDPTLQCAAFKDINPIQYDICVRNALAAPPTDVNATQTTAGGTFFRVPPQMNVQLRTSFNLTPKWAASWSTNYDFERHESGLQTVTLSRDMHDWRAVFGFTQAPNGNFTFTFFVALKAEPDLKFDYNRTTYGTSTSTTPP